MALPQSRSMNASLNAGATDGKYKKVVNNRDGVVEPQGSRDDLNDLYFGIHEAPTKTAPDGLKH